MRKSLLSMMLVTALFLSLSIKTYAAFPLKESNSDTASQEAQEYYNKLPQGVKDAFES